MLTTEEIERYQRQIMISGFGPEGQEKLKNATVFLAGAGGLGSPAACYLTAAGIGKLIILDSDRVELSNLNRQILHWTSDIQKAKVESAKDKLQKLNPGTVIEVIEKRLDDKNIRDLLAGSDAIVDAVDSLQTRYLLNQVSQHYRIPLFHGAVAGFEGRVMTIIPQKSACLMCLYRGVEVNTRTPVVGATPGVVACLQVTEVIKYLTGLGKLLTNRFLIYDGLNMRFAEIQVEKDPQCSHCGEKSGT